jgi:transcriptional regulator with XRE-family HTH domain
MSRGRSRIEGPHPVDIHVGSRLRTRRNQLGMSQTTLAEGLGITFQQVQKYERGANRISASMLYAAARVVGVPIGYFFEDLTEEESSGEKSTSLPKRHQTYLASAEGYRVIDAMSRLPKALRLKIMVLLTALQHRHTGEDDDLNGVD